MTATKGRRHTMDQQDEELVEEVHVITRLIRDHQDEIIRLSKRRRLMVLGCRSRRITYREIAEAMAATEQNVYKIIRGDEPILKTRARAAAQAGTET